MAGTIRFVKIERRNKMTLKEYKAKREQLLNEMQGLIDDGKIEDLAAKKKEIEDLDQKFEETKNAQADLNSLRNAAPTIPEIMDSNTRIDQGNADSNLDASSDEYRNAFLKHLLGRDEEMTRLENAAFLHTTQNTTAPLPTTMLNTIWDLVSSRHTIMSDITIYRTGTILEVVKHTGVVQGKAAKVAEGASNVDEQNTFAKVTLSGNDFSKHVNISYAEAKMSMDALESYLTNEIANSLGEAMADDVITTIKNQISAGNKITSKAVGDVTFKELSAAFGQLKRVGAVTVYATRATIYNYLVGMVDTTGRPIFQPSAQAGQEGTLLGAMIKVEDSVGDGDILIGDPKRVVYNMVQDIMIETDKDIKNHSYTYSGYARGQGALMDDASFVQLTVKTA